jgi:DNA mismatch endonuclease, patch repair protein
VVSPVKRSEMMAGIRSRNTRPEVLVRKLLHNEGYRFRLGSRIGRIQPDVVLRKWKTAILIHGCFWHGHDSCHLYRLPKSRSGFWRSKVAGNKERDQRVLETLRENGWNVVTVWECALKGRRRLSVADLVERLNSAICATESAHEVSGVSDHT